MKWVDGCLIIPPSTRICHWLYCRVHKSKQPLFVILSYLSRTTTTPPNNNKYHEQQQDHAPHTVQEWHPHQHHPVHWPKRAGRQALPPSWVAKEIEDAEEPQAAELGWSSITLLGTLPACFALPLNKVLMEYCRCGRRKRRKLQLRHVISHHVKLLHTRMQQFPYTFCTLQIVVYVYAMFLLYLIFLLQQWTYGFKPFTLF